MMKMLITWITGIALFAFAVYGWHQLNIDPIISMLLGITGLSTIGNALNMKLDT